MEEAEKIFAVLHGIHPEYDYRASTDYINDGLLDSFDLLLLVDELERSLGWDIPGDLIRQENFVSVAAMIRAFSTINR